MPNWDSSLNCAEETKERFERAKAQIRLDEEDYKMDNDTVLNYILDEAGYE